MRKILLCMICLLALCFTTACQAPACAHKDADDNGICDMPDCGAKFSDGIDTVCAHKDIDHDGICEVCAEECAYTRDEGYIYFGEYPQTLKPSYIAVTDEQDERGYYLGSDDSYYAKVVADPCGEGYVFANSTYVTKGETYYFRVDPIRWRVLSTDGETALLLCDSMIDNMAYDADSNNYKESEVRAWLNETFYETAFSELQKSIIQTTMVDNSADSTCSSLNPYTCGNTEDNVFLLSYADATNNEYGLDDTTRRILLSDYARASGAYMNLNPTCSGCGTWWLRSPYDYAEGYARSVYHNGCVYTGSYGNVSNDSYGIVPALIISLK